MRKEPTCNKLCEDKFPLPSLSETTRVFAIDAASEYLEDIESSVLSKMSVFSLPRISNVFEMPRLCWRLSGYCPCCVIF